MMFDIIIIIIIIIIKIIIIIITTMIVIIVILPRIIIIVGLKGKKKVVIKVSQLSGDSCMICRLSVHAHMLLMNQILTQLCHRTLVHLNGSL